MYKQDLARQARRALEERRKKKQTLEQAIEEAKIAKTNKKKLNKKEKNLLEYDEMLNYNENVPKENIVKEEKEWDVRIGDPIEFFDPNLSYELTGYRPITKDKGLDFDPKLFTEAADTYLNNGRYTSYLPNTFKWLSFWKEEFNKCLNGVTIGKYTLTGQNYFFLNYYRLLSPVKKNQDNGSKRSESFPVFIAKQYEYFHYLELCKKAEFDGLAFKSRGVNIALL